MPRVRWGCSPVDCRLRHRAAPSSLGPARLPRAWLRHSNAHGRTRSKASWSPATVTPPRRVRSRSWKHLTQCRTPLDSEQHRECSNLVMSAGPVDLVVALISGGASSLLSLPAPGLTLNEKRAVTSDLLRSGAPISHMNEVRKALSAVKGGRLAAVSRAPVVTYVISDVPGDDPATVGSGPTVAG